MTSLQKLLGHRRLDSTMLYARVHNRTVAEDYYMAMAKIEQWLNPIPDDDRQNPAQVLSLLDYLQTDPLTERQVEAVQNLRTFVLALTAQAPTGIPLELPVAVT